MKSYRFINIYHSFIAAAISLLSLLSLLTTGGCSDDFLPEPGAADGLVLSFYNSERTTRATDPSDGSLNETRLQSIAVALYADGAGDDAPAVKFARFSGFDAADGRWQTKMSISDSEAAALFGTVADGATCRLFAVANLSGDALPELEAMTEPTVNDLKAIAIDSEFAARQVQELFVMSGDDRVRLSIDAAGAKSAVGSVELVRTAAKITLSLNIEKEITETDADGNKTVYSPLLPSEGNPSTIRVLLNNGVGKSLVVPSASHTPADEDYFSLTTGSEAYVFKNSTDTEYPFTQAIPFYTYPNSWNNTPEELHRTAMTLIIPWLRTTVKTDGSTDTSVTTRYYTVPVTPASMPQILSNNSYRIDLNVGMLGSEQPDKPEDVTANYRVVSWATEDIDVDINDYRYLVVSSKSFVIDNVTSTTIPFFSSHDAIVKDVKISYERFASVGSWSGSTFTPNGQVTSIDVLKPVIDKSEVSQDGKTIKLLDYYVTYNPSLKQYNLSIEHPLKIWKPVDNSGNDVSMQATSVTNLLNTLKNQTYRYVPYVNSDGNEENAYSPYTITVTVAHKDKPEFEETLVITQYPAMYINYQTNPGTNDGNRFVNNGENIGNLGGENSSGSGHSNNNQYIINVTALDQNSGYIIGDPRTLFTENNLDSENASGRLITPTRNDTEDAEEYIRVWGGWLWPQYEGWCADANALYDGATMRTLRYYYPTEESEATANMVSPKFRVASSYGTVSSYYLGDPKSVYLRRRCATYQELGCPAGRWRVPTFGEIKYIVELHEKGFIPSLFTPGASYLSAQGWVYIPTDSDTDKTLRPAQSAKGNETVRAVYDDWYWEQESDFQIHPNTSGNYSYTLGDMPKRNPQD